MITVNFKAEVDENVSKRILKEISKDAMGGWMELPGKVDMEELSRIKIGRASWRERE